MGTRPGCHRPLAASTYLLIWISLRAVPPVLGLLRSAVGRQPAQPEPSLSFRASPQESGLKKIKAKMKLSSKKAAVIILGAQGGAFGRNPQTPPSLTPNASLGVPKSSRRTPRKAVLPTVTVYSGTGMQSTVGAWGRIQGSHPDPFRCPFPPSVDGTDPSWHHALRVAGHGSPPEPWSAVYRGSAARTYLPDLEPQPRQRRC